LWQNNWLVSLIGLLAVLNVALTLYLVYSVQPATTPLPIRFTSFTNFDSLGSWQNLYGLSLVAWLVSAVNVYLAQGVYRRSRITSVILILASSIFTLLAFQIALFFIGVSYGPN
jgi:hypothetical protein